MSREKYARLIAEHFSGAAQPTITIRNDYYTKNGIMEEFHAGRRKARKSPMTPSQSKQKKRRRPAKKPRDHYDDSSYRQADYVSAFPKDSGSC